MTLMGVGVAYGYLVSPRRSFRYVLAALMIPIAIITNAIRIMGAGILARHYGPAAAEGFLHEFSGWAIFLVALVLMFGSYWILRQIADRRNKPGHAQSPPIEPIHHYRRSFGWRIYPLAQCKSRRNNRPAP